MNCFFVSDLHGDTGRYLKLFEIIERERPEVLLLGGDLLPSYLVTQTEPEHHHQDFVNGFMVEKLRKLRDRMRKQYPNVFLILGNDDGRFEEAAVIDAATTGIWEYLHDRRFEMGKYHDDLVANLFCIAKQKPIDLLEINAIQCNWRTK